MHSGTRELIDLILKLFNENIFIEEDNLKNNFQYNFSSFFKFSFIKNKYNYTFKYYLSEKIINYDFDNEYNLEKYLISLFKIV